MSTAFTIWQGCGRRLFRTLETTRKHRATNRTCGERWQVAGGTVTAAIREVNAALRVVRPTLITPPSTETSSRIAESPKFHHYFENCIGAIDGTHIPAVVPVSQAKSFRNRKGFISQNVLAACDFDMKFCYLLAGWEGSAHDGRVYSEALKNGFPLAPGKYYLADAGYSLTQNTLTPYRGVRYQLKEWAEGNQKPQTKEELYNLRHSSLRNVIERIFGVLKQKFPLLRSMLSYDFGTQVNLVLGAAVIFNFIRNFGEIPGSLDVLDAAILNDLHIETENITAANTTVDTDSAAKQMRDQIATSMRIDYQVYLAARDRTVVI